MKTRHLLLPLLACIIAPALHAQTYDSTWADAAIGDWNNASLWSDGVPLAVSETGQFGSAIIRNGTVSANTTTNINSLRIAQGASENATLLVTDAAINAQFWGGAGTVFIADAGTSTITLQNAASIMSSKSMAIASSATGNSTLSLDSSILNASYGSLTIANYGTSLISLANASHIRVAQSFLLIAHNGTSTITAHDSGISTESDYIMIAGNPTGNSTISLGNSTLSSHTYITIADNGSSSITANAASTITANTGIVIADRGNSTITLDNNATITANAAVIAANGTSTINIGAGSLFSINTNLAIAANTTGNSTININGGTLQLLNGNITTGANGTSVFKLTDGNLRARAGGIAITNTTLTATRSTLNAATDITIAGNNNTRAILTLEDTTLDAGRDLSIATNGNSSITAGNSRIQVGGVLSITEYSNGRSTLALDNTTLTAASLTIAARTNSSLLPGSNSVITANNSRILIDGHIYNNVAGTSTYFNQSHITLDNTTLTSLNGDLLMAGNGSGTTTRLTVLNNSRITANNLYTGNYGNDTTTGNITLHNSTLDIANNATFSTYSNAGDLNLHNSTFTAGNIILGNLGASRLTAADSQITATNNIIISNQYYANVSPSFLFLTNTTLDAQNGSIYIAKDNGVFTTSHITASNLTARNHIIFANNSTANATLDINTTTLATQTGDIVLGQNGTIRINATDTTLDARRNIIIAAGQSTSVLNLDNATLDAKTGSIYIANNATLALNATDTRITSATHIAIATALNANATLNLTRTRLTATTGNLNFADKGLGTLNLADSQAAAQNNIYIAKDSATHPLGSSTPALTLDNSTLAANTGIISLAESGSGRINLKNNSRLTAATDILLATTTNAYAEINLDNSQMTATAGTITATGLLRITAANNSTLTAATNIATNGSTYISLNKSSLNALNGDITFAQGDLLATNNSTLATFGNFDLARNTGTSTNLTLTDTRLTAGNSILIAERGYANTTLTRSTLTATNNINLGNSTEARTTGITPLFDITASTLTANNVNLAPGGGIHLTATDTLIHADNKLSIGSTYGETVYLNLVNSTLSAKTISQSADNRNLIFGADAATLRANADTNQFLVNFSDFKINSAGLLAAPHLTIDTQNHNVSINAVLTIANAPLNTIALAKTGAGTLETLNTIDLGGRQFQINQGTLINNALIANSTLQVAHGATLTNYGIVEANPNLNKIEVHGTFHNRGGFIKTITNIHSDGTFIAENADHSTQAINFTDPAGGNMTAIVGTTGSALLAGSLYFAQQLDIEIDLTLAQLGTAAITLDRNLSATTLDAALAVTLRNADSLLGLIDDDNPYTLLTIVGTLSNIAPVNITVANLDPKYWRFDTATQSLLLTAIPEPQTHALILSAIALLAIHLYRRRTP